MNSSANLSTRSSLYSEPSDGNGVDKDGQHKTSPIICGERRHNETDMKEGDASAKAGHRKFVLSGPG